MVWYRKTATPTFPWLKVTLLGAAMGLLFHLLLFLLSLWQFQGAEYMGLQDSGIAGRVQAIFGDTILLLQMKILLIHLGLGGCLGGLLGLWLALLLSALGRFPRRSWVIPALLAGLLVLGHTLFLWYAMTRYPQLFLEGFYNAGWFGRWFQTVPSHWLPLWSYQVLASLFIVSLPLLLGLRCLQLFLAGRRRPLLLVPPAVITPIALLLVVLVWVSFPDSWRLKGTAVSDDPRPNVLLVAVDSMRPDVMNAAAGGAMKQIAAQSLVLEQAVSVFPRTFPAWASMLSGQYPHTHGIRHMFPSPQRLAQPLPSVARLLGEQGYETVVFSDFAGDIFARADFGFQRVEVPEFTLRSNTILAGWKLHVHLLPYLCALGVMDDVETLTAWERYADPEVLSDRFLEWLGQRDTSRPFFAVLFYSNAHFPYSPPYPYYRNRTLDDYDGPHRFAMVGFGEWGGQPNAQDQQQVRLVFQSAVDAIDDQVTRLRTALTEAGLWDRTVVILTADHGELMFENDRGNGHGDMLNGQESLTIPLLFRVPGRTPATIERPVSNTALAPTLLGLLGVPVPDWMEGENLAQPNPQPKPTAPVVSETGMLFVDPHAHALKERSIRFADLMSMFSFVPESWELYILPRFDQEALLAKHRAILDEGHKLIYVPTRQGPRFECYDLQADPNELTNLWSPSQPVCQRLKERLLDFVQQGGDGRRVGDMIVP